MSVVKASLLKGVAAALVAGLAIAAPIKANASGIDGLSVRVGGFAPSGSAIRNIQNFVWGGGIDYQVPWVPKVFNGEHWSTSISADFHYAERKSTGIFRYIPVAINQVYTFEEQNGHTPYAGFSLIAATFGTSGGAAVRQPTVTRFGFGFILGVNLTESFYIEGRYDIVDSHNTIDSPTGFRFYLGYRF